MEPNMKNFNTILAVGAVAAVCGAAEAGMVYWNMQTIGATSNNVAGVTSGNVVQGNNNGTTTLLSTSSASSGYSFDLNGTLTAASGQSNAGAAARTGALSTGTTGSAYFEFTLSADASTSATFSSFTFGSRSTGTGPVSYVLRSSLDGFASDLCAVGSMSSNSTWGLRSSTLTSSVTFTDATVTFRIYGYGGSGTPTAGTANWRIDDLALTVSSTAVPAPGAMALLGVAGLLGSRRRR